MATRTENGKLKLNTYEKSAYRLLELKRLRDMLLAKKQDELTPKQMSWIEKIGNFLWANGIWDVWAPANGIAKVASAVTPDSWRMPRWGSTNATRPNPLLNVFYPSTFWQWKTPEPDSWQINNSFNMDERVPTFSEVNDRHYANWDGINISYWPDKNGRHRWDDVDNSVFAHMFFWPAAYWLFTTPALATDAIWTAYASLRNWYNAIADYYDKHKANTWADKWVEDYLEKTKKQIAEAEKYEKQLSEKYKDYIDTYLPWDSENTDYPSFDDYVKKAVDADTLYYISSKLGQWPDEVPEKSVNQAIDYNIAKKTPTKAAIKTRDQIMISEWKNPYAVTRSVIEPIKYLGK